MITPEFLLTALAVVMIPGTGAIYTLSCGLTRGRGAALPGGDPGGEAAGDGVPGAHGVVG